MQQKGDARDDSADGISFPTQAARAVVSRSTRGSRMQQHLIIDADDTLWENNIYFERAFDEFVEFLANSTLSPQQVREVLDEIGRMNAKPHGYGSMNFGRNLRECYQRLAERHVADEDLETVMRFAERILEQPIEVIDDVP